MSWSGKCGKLVVEITICNLIVAVKTYDRFSLICVSIL